MFIRELQHDYFTFKVDKSHCIRGDQVFENLNPKFINEMFEIKDISCDLRDSNILFQPKYSNNVW